MLFHRASFEATGGWHPELFTHSDNKLCFRAFLECPMLLILVLLWLRLSISRLLTHDLPSSPFMAFHAPSHPPVSASSASHVEGRPTEKKNRTS
jgi:hypothetical protein